jgi:uncharacterized protein YggU (UPF0235/DUF167 family)
MSGSARLVVRLTPRAGEDRIDGWARDAAGRPHLKVRTTAAPTDGKANQALERLIAKALDLAPSRVSLASGASARIKTLEIRGADEALLRRRLGAPT